MAVKNVEQQVRKPWRAPEVRTQQVTVPTNLLFCSQFCCDIDGDLQCLPNAGACNAQGGAPGSGC